MDLGTNVSYTTDTTGITDPIIKAITKYEKHPSIIKINEALTITDKFNFPHVQCEDLQQIVNDLDVSKTTAYCSIPTGVEIRKKCITSYLCLILRHRRIFLPSLRGVSRLAIKKTTFAVIIDIKCSC